MKRSLLLCMLMVAPLALKAQTQELQEKWLKAVAGYQPIDELISPNGYLFYGDELIFNTAAGETGVTVEFQGDISEYRYSNLYINNTATRMTVGSFKNGGVSYFLLTGWRDFGSGWKKEVDVVFKEDQSLGISLDIENVLNRERTSWEEKANAHDPLAHTNYSYAEESVYFSGGRRNDGPEEIAERYSYMENPSYSVYLEDIYLKRNSAKRVVEIGRYSIGSRDSKGKGMYLIVWEEQSNGQWQIALDFNF